MIFKSVVEIVGRSFVSLSDVVEEKKVKMTVKGGASVESDSGN